jgi:hypothetical protein
MATIEVTRKDGAYEVTVGEGASRTRHRVTARAGLIDRLTPRVAPERAIEAAFRFLLAREPKEAILSTFDLGVISSYFPEFESKIADYLS